MIEANSSSCSGLMMELATPFICSGLITELANLPCTDHAVHVSLADRPRATLFTLAGTLFGLTITLARGEAGDIAYHVSLAAVLVMTVVLLVSSAGRRAVGWAGEGVVWEV